MLNAREIRAHYKRPEIVEAITRISTFGNCSRSGMKFIPCAYTDRETGEIRDVMDWYNLRPGSRRVKKKINLSSMKHYFNAVTECRTLYWTLNIFENEIYDIDYRQVDRVDGPMLSRSYTVGYTLGIDIDKGRGCELNEENKPTIEARAYGGLSREEHLRNEALIERYEEEKTVEAITKIPNQHTLFDFEI